MVLFLILFFFSFFFLFVLFLILLFFVVFVLFLFLFCFVFQLYLFTNSHYQAIRISIILWKGHRISRRANPGFLQSILTDGSFVFLSSFFLLILFVIFCSCSCCFVYLKLRVTLLLMTFVQLLSSSLSVKGYFPWWPPGEQNDTESPDAILLQLSILPAHN